MNSERSKKKPMRNAAANLMPSVEKAGQRSETKCAGDRRTEVLKSLRVAGSPFPPITCC